MVSKTPFIASGTHCYIRSGGKDVTVLIPGHCIVKCTSNVNCDTKNNAFFSFRTSLSNDVSWMPQKVSVFVSWRYFICNSVCAAAITHASRTRCLLGLGQGSEVYSWKLHKHLGVVLKKPGPEQSPGRSSLQNRCMAHG